MASAARTTGAEAQADELRRRNVASQSQVPIVIEPEKEKSKEKVRYTQRSSMEQHMRHAAKEL